MALIKIAACLTCGNEVKVTRRPPRNERYCSRACARVRPNDKPYFCKRKHGSTANYRVNKCGSRTCRDCEYELATSKRKADPETARERTRKWRELHPDESKASTRASVKRWRDADPDRARAAQRAFYRANKDRYFQAAIKRQRLIRESAINDFTIAQWEKLKADYEYRCAYCNKCADVLERDHVVPLSKGGDHTLLNVVPACSPCNRAKGASLMTPNYMRPAFR